jgi:hypothetical protein
MALLLSFQLAAEARREVSGTGGHSHQHNRPMPGPGLLRLGATAVGTGDRVNNTARGRIHRGRPHMRTVIQGTVPVHGRHQRTAKDHTHPGHQAMVSSHPVEKSHAGRSCVGKSHRARNLVALQLQRSLLDPVTALADPHHRAAQHSLLGPTMVLVDPRHRVAQAIAGGHRMGRRLVDTTVEVGKMNVSVARPAPHLAPTMGTTMALNGGGCPDGARMMLLNRTAAFRG